MNLVTVKFVESGVVSIKQQSLPGMGDTNKLPIRREHGKLNIDLTMAIDMAQAAIPHTFKRYKIQLFVVNSKNNREEMVFEEQGQSDVNPDEVTQEETKEPKSVKLEVLNNDPPEEGGKKQKKAKEN